MSIWAVGSIKIYGMDVKGLWRILEGAGLDRMVQRNTNIMACCPHPHHDEARPSWGISISPPHFHGCFACGFRGTLYSLLLMLGYSRDNALALSEHDDRGFDDRAASWTLTPAKAPKDIDRRLELGMELLSCRRDIRLFRYLANRRLSPRLIRLGDLRFDSNTQSIAIPWRDLNGDLIAIVRRRLREGHRYEFGKGGEKGKWLYVPRVPPPHSSIVLVEGELDALQCLDAGFHAVGLGHAMRLSAARLSLLKQLRPREIVLAFDSDPPGRQLTANVGRQLLPLRYSVKSVQWAATSEKLDPAACSTDQLCEYVQRSAPFAGQVFVL